MTALFRPRQSFLQNNAWQNQAINALHYNTAQQGSVVPLLYGTMRQTVNLIDVKNYRGPRGKKGKSGSLPISGTSRTGKGGGSSKGKGGKKNAHYTADVDFAVCQGPVASISTVYSSSGVEGFTVAQLNFYNGADGQAPDSHFTDVGYSGTCHVTGTPIDLGQSPVIPNLALEVTGILAGINTGSYGKDANPANVIVDFLTNKRYGAGFPPECLDLIVHDSTVTNTFGDYCQAAELLISTSLDGHQKAIEWLNGLMILTNSALVWSGKLLKVVPYGDLALNANSMTWNPNWTYQYDLTDDHFLPWHPVSFGGGPSPGEDDPAVMTRTNPSDADNWMSIEYTDRLNFYNSTTLTSFDQGSIDTYGLRIGDSLPGRAFAAEAPAQTSLQLILQRRLYIRNTGIKFQLGWQFALLEPMDLVTLTGRLGDNYLQEYPVRVISIEENDNGDLTIVAEDPQPGTPAPVTTPPFIPAILHGDPNFAPRAGPYYDWASSSAAMTDPAYDPIYEWRSTHPPDSPNGTFSVWVNIDAAHAPGSGNVLGFFQTSTVYTGGEHFEIAAGIDSDNSILFILHGVRVYQSASNTIRIDGSWQHVMISWALPYNLKVWVDGVELSNTRTPGPLPGIVSYSTEGRITFFAIQSGLLIMGYCFLGCSNDLWWDAATCINDPNKFRSLSGAPRDLGARGDVPLGRPPNVFLHYPPGVTSPEDSINGPHVPGSGYYGLNRAGYKCDDSAYWIALNNPTGVTTGPGSSAVWACDPDHPNFAIGGDPAVICSTGFLPYR